MRGKRGKERREGDGEWIWEMRMKGKERKEERVKDK
jgi:hypothetical protein